jgi:PAS domain S-box-containing protein
MIQNSASVSHKGNGFKKRKTVIKERIFYEQKYLDAILGSAVEGIFGINEKAECTFINKGALQLLGFSEKELLGKNLHDVTHYKYLDGTPYPRSKCPTFAAFKKKKEARFIEQVMWRKDGSPITVLISSIPIFEKDKVIGGVVTFFDIGERKELEKRKSEFVHIVSHELKTPITTIKAYTQMLQNSMKDSKDARHNYFLTNIATQIEKMNTLINDLLDSGKIEAGKFDFYSKPFNITELVKRIIVDFQLTTDTHQIEKKGDVERLIAGDKDRIGQVLINLLTNAIKYSPKGGSIVVGLKEEKTHAKISITDYGIGIAKSKQMHIFKQFYRVKDKDPRDRTSSGLGLYISSEIIKRHKGKIWVESSPGKGSTFFITLPFA